MSIHWEALNVCHPAAMMYAKGAERKCQSLVEEKTHTGY